ncbi:hypothetical protein G7067_11820 [Leucobacter insecticola]|uniref:Uncharacterized protein n=1 Tax=Leucobacter insecticola TaxID=2714934 RepID=A0A6G8FKQ2_9MICO|nr:hypothetical protein [Leucobacter insecticola]QIM16931.1 hypothetical protein G7067_11820 [Leucobacter insecticola]
MFVSELFELRGLVQQYFTHRAVYVDTVRHNPEVDREDGFVRFLLYESFVFGFGFSGAPYSSLGFFFQADSAASSTTLLGVDLTFVENDRQAISAALEHIDRYCRLRLPKEFLVAFDAAWSS